MNDNKQNSFETVDLLSPMEMLPIQDIGSPLEETEISKEVFPKMADAPKENHQSYVPYNTAVDTPQNPEIKKANITDNVNSNIADSIKGNITDSIKGYTADSINSNIPDSINDNIADSINDNINVYPDNNAFYNDPNKVTLNPEEIFRPENAPRRSFDYNNNRKRSVMLISFATFMIFMLFIVRMIISSNIKSFNAKDNSVDIPKNIIDNFSDLPVSKMIMQDEIYGTINMDSMNELDSDYVSISPEIIEYTGIYERCLYFKVTPKDDNVSVAINVEMFDGNGNSMGGVIGTGMGIPKDKEGIIPVSFSISPNMSLNDITYNISVESRKSSGKILERDISLVKVENGKIYASVSGDKNMDKYAYMVYYKNNKVVKVEWKAVYTGGAETVVLEFDTKGIDFDSSQIYY